jgi:hypothetical protein
VLGGSRGFAEEAPTPPSVLDRLFDSVEARRGTDPRATVQYIDNMLTTLNDVKTRTEQAVELAKVDTDSAQQQLYGLHNELGLFKSNLVPHSVHAYGKVIPNVTRRRVEQQAGSLTKEQLATSLVAIEKEFAGSRLEYVEQLNRECFVVRTHNVILTHPHSNGSGIMEFDFGPFDIALDLRRFASGQDRPYFCLAVEPKPAPGRRNCKHPHVLDDIMCEGNAGDVIQKVLGRGDLYTFFVIVNQTLNVYNPHSPHTALEKWVDGARRRAEAVYCAHCDDVITNNRVNCHACENVGHRACFKYCDTGGIHLCRRCLDRQQTRDAACEHCDSLGDAGCAVRSDVPCSLCDELREPSLMHHCSVSGMRICDSCLDRRAADHEACCASHNSGQCLLYTLRRIPTAELTY